MVKLISCKITGSGLCSDAWEDQNKKYEIIPKGIYVAQSNMIVKDDISVYDGNAFGDEEEDNNVIKVNDIISKFTLMPCEGLTKNNFKSMFTGYIKKVMKQEKMKKKAKESDEGKKNFEDFQQSAKSALAFYLKNFKDCDIYMNEDHDVEGAYVVGWWNPNSPIQDAPQMCYWLDGCDFRKL